MKTNELRAFVKSIEPEASVSQKEKDPFLWVITVDDKLDEVKAGLKTLGLHVFDQETIGNRWDWRYKLYVQEKD